MNDFADQDISRPYAGSSTGTGKDKVKVTLLKSRRHSARSSPQICAALQTEIDWVREKCKQLEAVRGCLIYQIMIYIKLSAILKLEQVS